MSRLIPCALAIVLASSTAALASSRSNDIFGQHGPYLSVSAGAIFPADSQLHSYRGAALVGNNVNFDIGPQADVALGYYLGHFRLEGELGYRHKHLSGSEFPSLRRTSTAGGHIDSLTFMANGYYDLPVRTGVQWYLGAGAGVARDHAHTSVTIQGFAPLQSDGTDWVPAFQVMTGVALRVAPKVHLTLGYRYWTTTRPTFNGSKFDAPGDSSVDLGLRFDF